MNREVTFWEIKVGKAIAWLEQHGEQDSYPGELNGDQIDDVQWQEAIRKYRKEQS
jgi:hypothetical protein